MKIKEIAFALNLVKGKIAETVFAQMLRSTGQFTVLEFGYEKIIPELIGRGASSDDEMIETLQLRRRCLRGLYILAIYFSRTNRTNFLGASHQK